MSLKAIEAFQYVCWQSTQFMSAAAADTLLKLLLRDLIAFGFLFCENFFRVHGEIEIKMFLVALKR